MRQHDQMAKRVGSDGEREDFEFIGGHLSLDFVNTLGGCRGGDTRELLVTYADLLAWGRRAGLVTAEEAQSLARESRREGAQDDAVLARARLLREAIYRLIAARMRELPPDEADLAALNAELERALPHRRVAISAEGPTWVWNRPHPPAGALDGILWPVAVAAAELLIARDLPSLRECASERCSWLFLDTTRNHSRRWCDMKGCGNQAKIRRYRQKRA